MQREARYLIDTGAKKKPSLHEPATAAATAVAAFAAYSCGRSASSYSNAALARKDPNTPRKLIQKFIIIIVETLEPKRSEEGAKKRTFKMQSGKNKRNDHHLVFFSVPVPPTNKKPAKCAPSPHHPISLGYHKMCTRGRGKRKYGGRVTKRKFDMIINIFNYRKEKEWREKNAISSTHCSSIIREYIFFERGKKCIRSR